MPRELARYYLETLDPYNPYLWCQVSTGDDPVALWREGKERADWETLRIRDRIACSAVKMSDVLTEGACRTWLHSLESTKKRKEKREEEVAHVA